MFAQLCPKAFFSVQTDSTHGPGACLDCIRGGNIHASGLSGKIGTFWRAERRQPPGEEQNKLVKIKNALFFKLHPAADAARLATELA